jgi:hypothetical protein
MGANPFIFIPRAFRRLLGEILYFPIHWYGPGFLVFIKSWTDIVSAWQQALGFSVWLKNIFIPMYGQRDFAGRLISFIMRLVQIIFRGIVAVLVLLLYVVVILVYVLLWPLLIIGFFI